MRIVENNRKISKNNGHFFREILKRIMGKNWGIMGSCLTSTHKLLRWNAVVIIINRKWLLNNMHGREITLSWLPSVETIEGSPKGSNS